MLNFKLWIDNLNFDKKAQVSSNLKKKEQKK